MCYNNSTTNQITGGFISHMNNITNFLGLQGILTDNFVENDNSIIISAHTPASPQLCPRCGKPTSFIHGYRTQKVKDLPMRL